AVVIAFQQNTPDAESEDAIRLDEEHAFALFRPSDEIACNAFDATVNKGGGAEGRAGNGGAFDAVELSGRDEALDGADGGGDKEKVGWDTGGVGRRE
ncbi:MAG: hypothetical protein L6R41_003198, partial [Letrouitia leprolyta]